MWTDLDLPCFNEKDKYGFSRTVLIQSNESFHEWKHTVLIQSYYESFHEWKHSVDPKL